MLAAAVRTLIRDEYTRHGADFIAGAALDPYLAKLDAHADVVSDSVDGRCRGMVAFYCNDPVTKRAYITLVLVDPRDRGRGLARRLILSALDAARQRGFTSCGLEVNRGNTGAVTLYTSLGFRVVEARERADLMEIAL